MFFFHLARQSTPTPKAGAANDNNQNEEHDNNRNRKAAAAKSSRPVVRARSITVSPTRRGRAAAVVFKSSVIIAQALHHLFLG